MVAFLSKNCANESESVQYSFENIIHPFHNNALIIHQIYDFDVDSDGDNLGFTLNVPSQARNVRIIARNGNNNELSFLQVKSTDIAYTTYEIYLSNNDFPIISYGNGITKYRVKIELEYMFCQPKINNAKRNKKRALTVNPGREIDGTHLFVMITNILTVIFQYILLRIFRLHNKIVFWIKRCINYLKSIILIIVFYLCTPLCIMYQSSVYFTRFICGKLNLKLADTNVISQSCISEPQVEEENSQKINSAMLIPLCKNNSRLLGIIPMGKELPSRSITFIFPLGWKLTSNQSKLVLTIDDNGSDKDINLDILDDSVVVIKKNHRKEIRSNVEYNIDDYSLNSIKQVNLFYVATLTRKTHIFQKAVYIFPFIGFLNILSVIMGLYGYIDFTPIIAINISYLVAILAYYYTYMSLSSNGYVFTNKRNVKVCFLISILLVSIQLIILIVSASLILVQPELLPVSVFKIFL